VGALALFATLTRGSTRRERERRRERGGVFECGRIRRGGSAVSFSQHRPKTASNSIASSHPDPMAVLARRLRPSGYCVVHRPGVWGLSYASSSPPPAIAAIPVCCATLHNSAPYVHTVSINLIPYPVPIPSCPCSPIHTEAA